MFMVFVRLLSIHLELVEVVALAPTLRSNIFRHSAEAGGAKSGVAQGDPLSMYLFCAAITPMLYEIEEHNPGISLCVYADDIL